MQCVCLYSYAKEEEDEVLPFSAQCSWLNFHQLPPLQTLRRKIQSAHTPHKAGITALSGDAQVSSWSCCSVFRLLPSNDNKLDALAARLGLGPHAGGRRRRRPSPADPRAPRDDRAAAALRRISASLWPSMSSTSAPVAAHLTAGRGRAPPPAAAAGACTSQAVQAAAGQVAASVAALVVANQHRQG